MHKVLLFSSFLSLSLSASQNPWPQRGLSAFTLSKDDKKNRISATMKEPHLVKSLIYIVLSLSLSLSLSPLLFFGSMLVKLWLPSLYLYKKRIFCMSVESLCVHLLEHLDEVVHNFSILVYQKI